MATGYDAYPGAAQGTAAPTRAMDSPIVVGSCGTWDSNGAIRLAQLFAQRDGRAVYVVGVVDTGWRPVSGMRESSATYDAGTVEALRERIERQLVELGVPEGQWPVGIVSGDRADTLGEIAGDDLTSLLLVGLKSHIAFERLWGRSTALGAANKGRRTVLAVDPLARALPTCAVVGTAFGRASGKAARAALECLGSFGSLHLVHVRPLMSQVGVGALSADVAYAQEITDRLEGMVSALGAPTGVQVRCHALSGDAATRLLEVARQEHADLIAVGTHNRAAFGTFLVGAVASRVLGVHRASSLGRHSLMAAYSVCSWAARIIASRVPARIGEPGKSHDVRLAGGRSSKYPNSAHHQLP